MVVKANETAITAYSKTLHITNSYNGSPMKLPIFSHHKHYTVV